MQVHNLIQGSSEWLAFRAMKYTSSDAAAMLGFCKYKTREALLYEKKTGDRPTHSAATQALFEKGHQAEAQDRAHTESLIGEGLSPIVGSLGILAASFDGVTFGNEVIYEHKLYNASLADYISANQDLPDSHWPQVEQALYVSGAKHCIFVTSDGIQGGKRFELVYKPKADRIEQILEGWEMFTADLDAFDVEDYETRQERTDDAWKQASAAFKEAKEQKAIYAEQEKEAKQRLIELANGKRTKGCDVNVYPMVRNNVDSKKIIADFNVNADEYTTQSTTWVVR
ncbi:MAG: YqaJ viral recombinase family protein [Pseudomonadota bacterium]|nr:YqaJ viral recombinase family protein [Pseudomonadota bacterium]